MSKSFKALEFMFFNYNKISKTFEWKIVVFDWISNIVKIWTLNAFKKSVCLYFLIFLNHCKNCQKNVQEDLY